MTGVIMGGKEREVIMKLNRTLLRAIDILDILSKNKEGYTLTQIASLLESPKSSVFDIVKTLVYGNMIVEDNQSGVTKYKIGLQSFLIGSSYLNDIDIIQIAKNDLIDLANKMHATTFMAILNDYKVVYIYKYESEHSIITTANIGTRGYLHSTGLGKVLMAFASEDVFKEGLKTINYEPCTPYTITSPEKYIDDLKEVRKRGYAIDDRENSMYQFCAAAPVHNHSGDVIAAISCSGLYDDFLNYQDLGTIVKQVADKISAQLGYISR